MPRISTVPVSGIPTTTHGPPASSKNSNSAEHPLQLPGTDPEDLIDNPLTGTAIKTGVLGWIAAGHASAAAMCIA